MTSEPIETTTTTIGAESPPTKPTSPRDVQIAGIRAMYALRAMWRRIDWDKIPQRRRGNLAEELASAVYPLVLQSHGATGEEPSGRIFFAKFAQRFSINPHGGTWANSQGQQRSSQAIVVEIPKKFVVGIPALPARPAAPEYQRPATPDHIARIRWDVLASAVDVQALELAMYDQEAAFASFVTSEAFPGEEDILFKLTEDAKDQRAVYRAELPDQASIILPRSFNTILTCVSDLAHGADSKSGNTTYFRRKKQMDQRTGQLCLVPFVSGNAWRGGEIRDRAGKLWCAALGLKTTDLPPHRAGSIFSGGTIEQGADTSIASPEMRRQMRGLYAGLDLLGGSYRDPAGDNGQLMSGVLAAHDLVLICRENAWVLFYLMRPTRPDGVPYASVDDFAKDLLPARAFMAFRQIVRSAHRDMDGSGDDIQMIAAHEVVVKGAQFFHSFQFKGLDKIDVLTRSFMSYILTDWADDGLVGAKTGAAHGRVMFDPYRQPGGEELPSPDIFLGWIAQEENRQAALDFTLCLTAKGGEKDGADEGATAAPKKGAKGGAAKGKKAKADTAAPAPPVVEDDVPTVNASAAATTQAELFA